MADFDNLLDDLQERSEQEYVDGVNDAASGEDGEQSGNDGEQSGNDANNNTNEGQDWELAGGNAAVPAALQDAGRKDDGNSGDDDFDDNDGDSTGMVDGMNNKTSKMGLDDGTGADDDDDADAVVNKVYDQLHTMWLQERHCPELLSHNEELVDQIQQQLEEQQNLVDELEESDGAADAVMSSIIQMDHDRTKFVLSDMLSCRLSKIEQHPLYMRERLNHMSDAEISYLQQYGALMESHMQRTVLDHLPEAWQRLDEDHMIDRPNRDAYHFWYVRESIETDDGNENPAGTTLLAKYDKLEKFFINGKVEMLM